MVSVIMRAMMVAVICMMTVMMPVAQGVTCYVCQSADTNEYSTGNGYCYYPMDKDRAGTCTGSRCTNFNFNTDNGRVTIRNCTSDVNATNTNCNVKKETLNGTDITGELCLCSTDYCNTASTAASFTFLLVVTQVLYFIQKKL